MFVAHVTTNSHVDAMVCVAACCQTDISELYYHQGPYLCEWPVLSSEAIMMSMSVLLLRAMIGSVAHVVMEGRVDICGLCCQWRPC